jgi:hypothetical protein
MASKGTRGLLNSVVDSGVAGLAGASQAAHALKNAAGAFGRASLPPAVTTACFYVRVIAKPNRNGGLPARIRSTIPGSGNDIS